MKAPTKHDATPEPSRTRKPGKRRVYVGLAEEGRAVGQERLVSCAPGATAPVPAAAQRTSLKRGAGKRGEAGSGGGASKAAGRGRPMR